MALIDNERLGEILTKASENGDPGFEALTETLSDSNLATTVEQRFNHNYITAFEIMDRVNVTRPSVLSKMKSRFPAIRVGNSYIWERTPDLMAFLEAWETVRKGV